jgi:chromosome segregation ATPase
MPGGKSAILTAIAVALGGKAALTGRGTGMKDLIRKGCE